MKNYLLLLTFLIWSPVYAHAVELCIPGFGECRLAFFSEGGFSVISMEGTSSHQQDSIAAKQLATKGIYFNYGTVSVARYNQLKAQENVETVTKTKDEILSEFDINRTEIRDLLTCAVSSAGCGGATASLALTRFAGIPVMLMACTTAGLSCDQALESLDKYHDRVVENIKLLREIEAAENLVSSNGSGGGTGFSSGDISSPFTSSGGSIAFCKPLPMSGNECMWFPATEVSTSDGDVWINPGYCLCTNDQAT